VNTSLLRTVDTVVSHADCPDGIASAMILHRALPSAAIVFIEHNTPEQRALPANRGMLFCDIAPAADRLAEFVAAEAIVLDHHKGARDAVAAFGERGRFADERQEPGVSGALLAYREAFRPLLGEDVEVERFARLAGIRDTWQNTEAEWDEACAQATALTFFGYEHLSTQVVLSPDKLEVGRLLLSKKLETARGVAAHKCFKLRPDVVMFNDRDRVLSDVAHFVLEVERAVQIVCGFHYKVTSDGAMLLVYALRSRRDGVDVAAIAKANGGGGHSSAAGFSVAVDGTADPVATLQRVLS
jgi:nanoRNase/pAp phosphatase (c-di-AMP/oligoRNAs hydrolase)